MKLQPNRLLQTVAGKAVAAVLVVSTGVGAAAAAGADVPMLTSGVSDEVSESAGPLLDEAPRYEHGDTPDEERFGTPDGDDASVALVVDDVGDAGAGVDDVGDEVVANHGEVVSAFAQSTELTGCEKGQATAAVARGDVDPAVDDLDVALAPYLERCADDEGDDVDAGAGVDDVGDEVVANHGEVVSAFAQSTELTGCEKGQATAAVARGDVDPAVDDLDVALAPYLERCDGDDEPVDEASTSSGRPEHAKGKGNRESESAGKSSNAGGNGRGNGKP